MKKITLILFVVLLSLSPVFIFASELSFSYPSFGGIKLEMGMSLSSLVLWFFYLIISIASAAAVGMIIWGGIEYLTSAGDPNRMASGADRIKNALIGIVIISISYLVLQIINPQLLELPDIERGLRNLPENGSPVDPFWYEE